MNTSSFQPADFAAAAAEYIASVITAAAGRQGFCSLVLSGGSTPAPVYRRLADLKVPWSLVHLFWGDERHVSPSDPNNNYYMAEENLLSRIPVPPENINRIHTEFLSADDAAETYEQIIRNFAAEHPLRDDRSVLIPAFDLVLLGIGADGHTASLFPDSSALRETERLVVATGIPDMEPKVRRITMTIPLLNAARTVLFLVSDQSKLPIIQAIENDPETAKDVYPAARIAGREQTLLYYSV